jgi:hypothetical protein
MDNPESPKVPIQINVGGAMLDAFSVPFKAVSEAWSDYLLEDGTTLRVKPVPVEFYRAVDRYDADGNPSYYVRTQTILLPTGVPTGLRKPQ